jgi:hypothetical protein
MQGEFDEHAHGELAELTHVEFSIAIQLSGCIHRRSPRSVRCRGKGTTTERK